MRVGVAFMVERGGGVLLGSGTAKAKTWTTGEQQAHVHIHHKTSTILYIDIWTSSPGGGWGRAGLGSKVGVAPRRGREGRWMWGGNEGVRSSS